MCFFFPFVSGNPALLIHTLNFISCVQNTFRFSAYKRNILREPPPLRTHRIRSPRTDAHAHTRFLQQITFETSTKFLTVILARAGGWTDYESKNQKWAKQLSE